MDGPYVSPNYRLNLTMTNKKNIVIKVKYPTPTDQGRETEASAKIITEWNVKRIVIALGTIILIVSFSLYFVLSKHDTSNLSSQLPEKTVIPEPNKNVAVNPEQVSAPDTKPAISNGVSQLSGMTAAPESNENTAAGSEQVKGADNEPVSDGHDKKTGQPLQFKLSEANKVISNQAINQIKKDIRSEKSVIETRETAKETQVALKKKSPAKRRSHKLTRTVLASKIINKEPVHILNSPIRVTKAKTVWINYFTEFKDMNNNTVYHEWLNKDRVVYKHRFNISADRWRAASRKPFNHTSEGYWQVRAVDGNGRLLDQKEFKVILDR